MTLQILDELTTQYGRADHEMAGIYKHLRRQRFPTLGESLYVLSPGYRRNTASNESSLAGSRRASLFHRFSLDRRGSTFGRLLTRGGRSSSTTSTTSMTSNTEKRRIKRPIDFRLEGAPICHIFDELNDILLLYATVLMEKRLLIICSSLRYITCSLTIPTFITGFRISKSINAHKKNLLNSP